MNTIKEFRKECLDILIEEIFCDNAAERPLGFNSAISSIFKTIQVNRGDIIEMLYLTLSKQQRKILLSKLTDWLNDDVEKWG